MNQLELQNAMKLIEKFEELQEEFNSKYEDLEININAGGDLKISCDYFKAFIPLCTIFKFYHINGDKSLSRKLSPHVSKSNTKL